MVARNHPFASAALAAMIGLAPVGAAPAQPRKSPQKPGAKLVVLLVVDQFRTDYITEYGHHWKHGLRRLIDGGAWFPEAAYPYLKTVTCAGHATISTGTFPSTHGMILNAWYDRKSKKMMNCTDDPLVEPVVYGRPLKGMGYSSSNLRAPTFADALIAQPGNKNAQVITFSVKARSAITMGGKKADAVTWLEGSRGLWMTSRAYSLSGVPFIRHFVENNPVTRDFGKVWDRSMALSDYKYADEDAHERPPGWDVTFPHVLKGNGKPEEQYFEQWRASPFSDEYVCEMAINAVDRLSMGRKDRTDMLAVSFAALDTVGHDFGPRSHEVQDLLYRLDATLGKLLEYLDKEVGARNYVVALSSDHGVATMPEQLTPEGVDAGRVVGAEVQKQAEAVLQKHFGPGKYVARSTYTDLYFEKGVEERIEANAAVMKDLKESLMSITGVGWVLSRADIAGQQKSADPVVRAAALSHFPDRSGDWIIIPKKNWYFRANDATTHGTLHWYDAQVPVIFYGYGIKPGRYSGAASPADIAPTLAHILGFKMPMADGRALTEAILPAESHAGSGSR